MRILDVISGLTMGGADRLGAAMEAVYAPSANRNSVGEVLAVPNPPIPWE